MCSLVSITLSGVGKNRDTVSLWIGTPSGLSGVDYRLPSNRPANSKPESKAPTSTDTHCKRTSLSPLSSTNVTFHLSMLKIPTF